MVSTRRSRVGDQTTTATAAASENKIINSSSTETREEATGSPTLTNYEQIRQQRIRENLAKMEKLGIFKVSAALKPKSGRGRPRNTLVKPTPRPVGRPRKTLVTLVPRPVGRPRKTLTTASSPPIPIDKPQNWVLPQGQRCSLRLKGLAPVNYSDVPDNGDSNVGLDEYVEEETG